MSDPRFARLKTDPRFRKPRKKQNKVVVDERFKSIFEDEKESKKGKTKKVDKYGRKVSATADSDNLKRFYRLEEEGEEAKPAGPDYARGEVLMESSSEEEDDNDKADDSEADDGIVVLGRDVRKPIQVPKDDLEIDLDESAFAELDALAEATLANSKEENASGSGSGEETNRLAVVNLDWDHVKASHLFKIFSSVLLPGGKEKGTVKTSRGKVLSIKVYPSQFGKERLEKEAREGPPKEIFKRRAEDSEDEDGEGPVIEEDDGREYDEDALRKYQLERLRYYYAIVTCDTVDAAVHIYSELDGTELERSANLFDLSYVPNDMTFDEEPKDEATRDTLASNFKGVEFVTDALRHSRVKLTWDDDDPERMKITRRALSKKEIDEADFRALIASSESEDDADEEKRDKMRALLLGDGTEDIDTLPEGWGKDLGKGGDMEITFTPGLSGKNEKVDEEEETTLQRYLRKQKEKRKKKKITVEEAEAEVTSVVKDEFFSDDSDEEEEDPKDRKKKKGKESRKEGKEAAPRVESTTEELELLVGSADPSKHFDMKSILKTEKAGPKKGRKRDKKKKKDGRDGEDETQQDFSINVNDERFKSLHEDHAFAIDPTNPHFKKTKSMAALLEARAKRQRNGAAEETRASTKTSGGGDRSLSTLVESVKRKSAGAMLDGGGGKRRKV